MMQEKSFGGQIFCGLRLSSVEKKNLSSVRNLSQGKLTDELRLQMWVVEWTHSWYPIQAKKLLNCSDHLCTS